MIRFLLIKTIDMTFKSTADRLLASSSSQDKFSHSCLIRQKTNIVPKMYKSMEGVKKGLTVLRDDTFPGIEHDSNH